LYIICHILLVKTNHKPGFRKWRFQLLLGRGTKIPPPPDPSPFPPQAGTDLSGLGLKKDTVSVPKGTAHCAVHDVRVMVDAHHKLFTYTHSSPEGEGGRSPGDRDSPILGQECIVPPASCLLGELTIAFFCLKNFK
jgi:hypothetical protein